jgi:O-antigen/teichoic acid export membrane protein
VPRTLTAVVVRGASLASAGFLLTQVLTFATYVVLARLAPPETFGMFAAASIASVVTRILTESGMTAAVIQRRSGIEAAAATAFISTFIGGLLLTLVAAALAPLVGLFFRSGEITRLALALSGIHALNGLTVVPEALLVRRFSFTRAVVVEPLAWVVFAAVSIVSFVEDLGPWSLVLGTYAYGTTRVILAWSFCRWLPDLALVSWRTWKELARFARHVVLGEFLRESRQALNVALVGRALGFAPLAQYRFGLRIATQLPEAGVQGASYVLLPTFSRIAEDTDRFGRAFLRSIRSLSLITIPLSLMLVPLGEPVAALMFGKEWREAGRVAAALVGISATVALLRLSAEVFKAAARPQNIPIVNLLLAVVPGLLMVAGLPFGLIGVAIGMSLGTVFVTVEATRRASAIVNVPLASVARAVWPGIASGALAAGVVFVIDRLFVNAAGLSTFASLAVIVAEFLLGVFVALLATAVLSRDSLRDFLSAARAALSRDEPEVVGRPAVREVEEASLEPDLG